ncbi:MAG: serine/threonine protein phosphatase [Thiohalocapsa sp.]
MTSPPEGLPGLILEPVANLRSYRKVPVAKSVRFNQIIVTGPPGSGKSTFVRQLGGWPEEGYVDLALKGWWRAQALAVRPREVHLGLPFEGRRTAMALFEEGWLEHWKELRLDEERVRTPPPKRHLLSVNWLGRFVFEFMLPPPERILADRLERARQGTHPVDARVDLDQIRAQVALFSRIALHFHRCGVQVYVRERVAHAPSRIAAPKRLE